jgi:pimeloyl-ACP methyl ester carboxylesterase
VDGFLHSIEHGMFVRTRGVAHARAIVYIHGLGESGLCFERLAHHPALAAYRHVIPDLPGYGRSAWTPRIASLPELAELVAGWLAARGEPSPVLVGHSMGGVIGVLLCDRHPHAVGAFVDVEGNVSIGDCTGSAIAAAQPLLEFTGGGFDRQRDQVYADGASDRALRGYYASMRLADPRAFHQHSRELVEASRDESMAARLVAIAAKVPLVYVAGVPRGAAPRTLELLDARAIPTVRVAPAGHWPFLDQPDAVARAIADLAARVA